MKSNKKYKYVYEVRTDNLCYGGKLLGVYNNKFDAYLKLHYAITLYGCCIIKKVRKYL